MNKYCLDLSFPIDCINLSFDPKAYKGKRHSAINENIFTSEFISLLDDLNLKITWSEIFHVAPSKITTYAIHTDSTGGDYVKLNWIFGGANSKMNWYELRPGVVKEPDQTTIGSSYISFTENEVNLTHSQAVGFPSFVQVGIPHNIFNPVEDRYCVSIMLRDKTTDNRLTMEQVQLLFKTYIR